MLHHYCWIQYCRHSIIFQFQSFWKSRAELHLVCKQICNKTKWTKDQVLTELVWILIQNKVYPLFPNIGIRRKAMQRLFFHNLALNSILLSSEPSWFLSRAAFSSLVIYTTCANLSRDQNINHLANATNLQQHGNHLKQWQVLHW